MERQGTRRFWAAFALLGAAALTVRAAACAGDLWLDEVLSYETAAAITSALGIVEHAVSRNSHGVTVLWMYLVGDTPHWWLYRLPSLVAGCLLLPLAALPLRRQAGDRAALAAAALFGAGFFMITYASEARAYAGIMLHALLAFRLAEEQERRPGPAVEWAVGACLLGGAFWQPIFVLVWGAFALWALAARLPRATAFRMLALPAAAVAGGLAWGFRVHSAAAAPGTRLGVLWHFMTAGFALPGPPAVQAAVAAALGAAVAASFLRRPEFESRRIAALRLLLCVVPVAGVLAAPTLSIFPRYFSAALPLLYLSVLYGLRAAAAPRGGPASWAAGALGLLLLASNAAADAAFLRDGRGHYLDALRWMAARTPRGETVRWITDHPYRNGMLVGFFARYVPEARFEAVSHKTMGDRPARWAILHQGDDDAYPFAPPVLPVDPHRYRWVKTFAKSGLSGFRWHLYELEARTGTAAPAP